MIRKPPAAALLASSDDTEQQFYEALQRGDLEKLMAVWSDDDDICCVHPGSSRIVGPNAVRASFESVLSNGNTMDVHPEKVRRVITHDSAVHSVLERIQVMTENGPQMAWIVATNVYVKTSQGWRMVAHHASPGVITDVSELAGETPAVLH